MTVLEAWANASSRIDERAKTLSPRQVALLIIAAVPLAIGFVVFWIWKAAWVAFTWVWASVIEGWELAGNLSRRERP